MSANFSPVELLVELELVKRLKYAYMRCIDQKTWDELRTLFTEDVTSSYGGGAYTYEGRDAVMAFLVKSMDRETFLSSHTVHHPEIDFLSNTVLGVCTSVHQPQGESKQVEGISLDQFDDGLAEHVGANECAIQIDEKMTGECR